jgi:hypothetical protein
MKDMSEVSWAGTGVAGSSGVLMNGRWQMAVNARDEAAPGTETGPEAPETEEGDSDQGLE